MYVPSHIETSTVEDEELVNPIIEENIPKELLKEYFNRNTDMSFENQIKDEKDTWILSQNESFELKPVLPPLSQNYNSWFNVIQSWEGTVVEISDQSFEAELVDLSNRGAKETVEIEIDDVSEEDRSLIVKGSIFYMSFGKEVLNGQISNTSIIRFRRLPPLDDQQVARSVVKFKNIFNRLFGV